MSMGTVQQWQVVGLSALAAGFTLWSLWQTVPQVFARLRSFLTTQAQRESAELFWFFDIERMFRAYVALMVIAGGVMWLLTGVALAGLAFLVLAVVAPRMAWKAMRRRRQRRFDEQLPDALLIVAGALRVGLGLPAALQQMVQEASEPLSQEFGLLLREHRLGVAFDQCLLGLNRRMPTQSTILMVSAMRVSIQSGGTLAETLETAAHTLRQRLQMDGKVRALTSQGRMQAWVVGGLPMLLLLIMARLEPSTVAVFWSGPLGWAALTLIGFLELMGALVIRRIVSIDV